MTEEKILWRKSNRIERLIARGECQSKALCGRSVPGWEPSCEGSPLGSWAVVGSGVKCWSCAVLRGGVCCCLCQHCSVCSVVGKMWTSIIIRSWLEASDRRQHCCGCMVIAVGSFYTEQLSVLVLSVGILGSCFSLLLLLWKMCTVGLVCCLMLASVTLDRALIAG